MIDRFQQVAASMRLLKLPLVVLGLLSLGFIAFELLGLVPGGLERLLEPSIVGLIWALTAYSFVSTFEDIPTAPDSSTRFVLRVKQRLSRVWYWFIALMFVVTTVFALVLTGRLVSVWLRG